MFHRNILRLCGVGIVVVTGTCDRSETESPTIQLDSVPVSYGRPRRDRIYGTPELDSHNVSVRNSLGHLRSGTDGTIVLESTTAGGPDKHHTSVVKSAKETMTPIVSNGSPRNKLPPLPPRKAVNQAWTTGKTIGSTTHWKIQDNVIGENATTSSKPEGQLYKMIQTWKDKAKPARPVNRPVIPPGSKVSPPRSKVRKRGKMTCPHNRRVPLYYCRIEGCSMKEDSLWGGRCSKCATKLIKEQVADLGDKRPIWDDIPWDAKCWFKNTCLQSLVNPSITDLVLSKVLILSSKCICSEKCKARRTPLKFSDDEILAELRKSVA